MGVSIATPGGKLVGGKGGITRGEQVREWGDGSERFVGG